MTMGLRFSWLSLSLVACGVASGCAPSTPSGLPPGVTVAPDGVGFCCQAGTPSCECRGTGGHVDVADQCSSTWRTCDAHPALWQATTDAHGCFQYRIAMWAPGTGSCVPSVRRDTGTRRLPDVSFVDAGPDIDAQDANVDEQDANVDAQDADVDAQDADVDAQDANVDAQEAGSR